MPRYIDLTQTFTKTMPVYPGDRAPELKPVASLESEGESNFELTTTMHVGTHVDGPAHMIVGGKRLLDFFPETFFGRVIVVEARHAWRQAGGKKEIGAEVLAGVTLERDDIVLLATGWAEKYGRDNYYTEYPAVQENFAEALVLAGVKILGLDSPSPDRPPFPVHKILLREEILIIENLTNVTKLLGQKNIELVVAPLKIEADSAPARVMAKIESSCKFCCDCSCCPPI